MAKIQGSHEIINGIVYNLQKCEERSNSYEGNYHSCTGFNNVRYREEGLKHWIYQVQPGTNNMNDYSFNNDKIDLRKFGYQCEDLNQKLTHSKTTISMGDGAITISFGGVYAPIDCDIFLFAEVEKEETSLELVSKLEC